MNALPIRRQSISIRRLEPRDIGSAAAIYNQAIVSGESTYGPDVISEERLRNELFDAPPQFESYACDGNDDGPVYGWAALARHTHRDIYDTVAELMVFVSAEHRRRGLGRALAEHALSRAPQLGFRVLLLIVQPEPAFLLAWAMRHDFRSAGRLSGVLPVGERWQDILVFERFLEGSR
jgi:L-amino acid N-acyltransferase YncA